MINIPHSFSSGVIAERGEAGAHWLQELPKLIDKYCALWSLTIDGDVMHGYLGIVLPVQRAEESCALKLTWVDDETRHESLALQLWAGNGAVKLLLSDAEEGAMLLERLDSSCSLAGVTLSEAIPVAGRLLRRLAIPAPEGIPTVKEYAERQWNTMHRKWLDSGRPFPEQYVASAREAAREVGPSAQNLLVNQDLHYENVLAGTREPWIVIDPKVIVGDVEFGVAPLLWNRLDDEPDSIDLSQRFQLLVDSAQLDHHRAWCWTLVRCVDYWLWALDIGLTEDPLRCTAIVRWLMET